MTGWTETYRGTVPPWQCDVTEHFTIAYYFDRLEEAEASLADELGLSDLSRRAGLVRHRHLLVSSDSAVAGNKELGPGRDGLQNRLVICLRAHDHQADIGPQAMDGGDQGQGEDVAVKAEMKGRAALPDFVVVALACSADGEADRALPRSQASDAAQESHAGRWHRA